MCGMNGFIHQLVDKCQENFHHNDHCSFSSARVVNDLRC